MRRAILLSLVVSLVIVSVTQAATRSAPSKYVSNEIIVKFRETIAYDMEKQPEANWSASSLTLSRDLDELNTRYRVRKIEPLLRNIRRSHKLTSLQEEDEVLRTQKERRILRRSKRADKDTAIRQLGQIYRIKLDLEPGQRLQEVVQAYQSSPDVEYAELNYVVSISAMPDDPRYLAQWSLDKIDAPEAWDVCTGSSDIIVAVVDTGVDYNHRDLRSNVWVNEAELTGIEGVDDDENGYVDDIRGYNFVYNNSDPIDDHGHGTHCAGIIAAEGNNGLDVAGVCWKAKVMALKFLGSRGEGSTADAVLALHYAVANGADVISNSWGGDSESDLLRDAIDYAHGQGVIVVAAAGNSNSDLPYYPASYEHVVSVAATDSNDDKWSLSNYGDLVDIAAPGAGILSLRAEVTSNGSFPSQYTTVLSGTSMAAPHVAGAYALLLSANPLLTGKELYDKLTKSGDEILPEICASGRRLNLSRAMHAVVPSRGYVRLDQDYYTRASTVGVVVADWDLTGQRSQEVTFDTRQGDREVVVLSETSSALGVFAGTISTESGEPNVYDGVIQVSHGEVIRATYWDVNDGGGSHTTNTDEAIADYEVPTILDLSIGARGPVARIVLVTSEPTTAQIRCGLECGGPYEFVKQDPLMSIYHLVKLQPLSLGTDYYFVIDLTDAAGNATTLDSDGLCYSFSTQAEFLGFRVPNLYRTIQAAIDDAWDGDVIWVADGTYSGEGNTDIDFTGKAITVRSENGPADCIIDCQLRGRGFDFHNGEGKDSVLDGFTIKSGFAGRFGGGIKCTASSPTITNCIITGSLAEECGGGMYNCYSSNPIVSNCTFSANSVQTGFMCSAGDGGGMYNVAGSSPVLTDCRFEYNMANYSGAGMYNYQNSNPTLVNCTFTQNRIENSVSPERGFGGGISNWSSSPSLSRCTFSRNSAGTGGGVYNCYGSYPTLTNCAFGANSGHKGGAIDNYEAGVNLTNCTFAGNSADLGRAILNGPGSSSILTNCILWGNYDSNGTDESAQVDSAGSGETLVINYCCIQGWADSLAGTGNIDADPLFVDPNNGDYHLRSAGWRWDGKRQRWDYDDMTSPCIDLGNPGSPLLDELLAVPDDPNNDWGLNLRINMGVYGGTVEASMAPYDWAILADLTNDGVVNWRDFVYTASSLLTTDKEQACDLNRDGVVGLADVALLAEDWLKYIKPPVVDIIYPLNGTRFEQLTTLPVEIEAVAWDIDGSIVKVEFFANLAKIGEDNDSSDGWKISWQGYAAGVHTLTARAIDRGGITTTSRPIEITVIPPR